MVLVKISTILYIIFGSLAVKQNMGIERYITNTVLFTTLIPT